MKVLKWIDDHFEEALISIIICVISVLMMAQIILRSFFSASLSVYMGGRPGHFLRHEKRGPSADGYFAESVQEAGKTADCGLRHRCDRCFSISDGAGPGRSFPIGRHRSKSRLDPCAYVSGVCIHVGGTGPVHHKNPGAVYQNAPAPVFACGE